MTIKNVVFDFGGVLVEWDPRYLYRKHFEDEEEMEYFLANVCTDDWNLALDRGESFEESIQALTKKFPKYEKPIRLFKDEWEQMIHGAKNDAVDFVRQLKSQGYQLYGLSNWSHETFPIALEKFDFFDLFHGIVISGHEKVIKPDKEIYEILLSRYNLKVEETVFIDDKQINVEGAEKLGIKSILFKNTPQLIEDFNKILATATGKN